MALDSYAALQVQVSRWIGGSGDEAFAEAVRDSVTLLEAELDRVLRVPEMIQRLLASIDKPIESLPADVVKPLVVSLVDGGRETALRPVSQDALPDWARRGGRPCVYALQGGQIRVAPSPTEGHALRLVYYGRVPRLSVPTSCTATLAAYPDLYLWGTLKNLAAYTGDERLPAWTELFVAAVAQANRSSVTRQAA